jgi:hypothetical protein
MPTLEFVCIEDTVVFEDYLQDAYFAVELDEKGFEVRRIHLGFDYGLAFAAYENLVIDLKNGNLG